VIELRTSPRFDIGGFTRQDAFQAFKVQNINYCDLTSSTMGATRAEEALDVLRKFLREARIKFDRPIVFLVDRAELNPDVIGRVMQALTEYSPEPKIVFEVPHFENEFPSANTLAYL
jgi:Lon protease-like protein